MGRKRKTGLRSIVFLYSLCLTGIFVLAAILLAIGIRVTAPNGSQDLYISVDGTALTENGLMVPLEELGKHLVTSGEINSPFIPYYNRLIVAAVLATLVASLLASLLFACFLIRRLIKPIKETAQRLKRYDGKVDLDNIQLPQELADIEAAFAKAQEEIAGLRGELENMSSYISHDQKNSLAVLRAMIQNEYPQFYGRISSQLDRMVKNLDDILTLTASANKQGKVDLPLICGTATDEYRRIYKDISFDFDEDAALFVAGDEFLLHRAVSNLIDNAIKYGDGKPVRVYVGSQGDCPYVSVEDNGIGISMEQQEKIFESRYRIGNRKKDGYGIGLSLVRHVVELHSGVVWVESRENCGAKFKLVFPAFTLD